MIADDLGLSDELDGESRDAAAAMHTVQGMPGVMEAQSRTAQSGAAEVAPTGVQGAQDKAQEEQKWQSFMAEHFGECPAEAWSRFAVDFEARSGKPAAHSTVTDVCGLSLAEHA